MEEDPLIGTDEAARQLLSDVFDPRPLKPGQPKRVDDKYSREGTCSLFLFYIPISGWRRVGCRDSRTAYDWAEEVRHLLEVDYPHAVMVTRVCDTHHVSRLYKAFDAEMAGRLRSRLRLVYTPVNGSWLNVAEMELSLMSRQCLGWQFTTADARIKLRSLYPIPDIK